MTLYAGRERVPPQQVRVSGVPRGAAPARAHHQSRREGGQRAPAVLLVAGLPAKGAAFFRLLVKEPSIFVGGRMPMVQADGFDWH